MKKIFVSFVALAFCSFGHSKDYTGISISSVDVDVFGITAVSPTMITGRFGTSVNPTTTAEVRVGFGMGSDEIGGADISVENVFGAYLKFHPSAGDAVPYLIAGFTRGKLEVANQGQTVSASEDDFSFGAGVDFPSGFNVEFMTYLDKQEIEISGISAGLNF